jgi:hypothetical protein
MLEKIEDAYCKAKRIGKKIECIVLTSEEMSNLKNEYNDTRKLSFFHRFSNKINFLFLRICFNVTKYKNSLFEYKGIKIICEGRNT